ncbi:PTS sugar transporter subunit IIA [Tetragenococcus halophilus]|uniref:PTS sugar transporter subunit IIA n=2 Tax=Tetragenococcus halophilus TaxID=51669 RepID=UPI000B9283FB|nr:PTS sugar transporter subunit IIA [Tetragenococcus halophilus]
MFEEEIAFFKVEEVNNQREALNYLSERLENTNITKSTFKDAIIKREECFPTGLQLENYGVAIPHADSIHVNKSQIAMMTLKEPIFFKEMSDASLDVPVNLIFMLALKDSKSQLSTLRALMRLLQNEKIIKSILDLEKKEESVEKLKELLKNYLII